MKEEFEGVHTKARVPWPEQSARRAGRLVAALQGRSTGCGAPATLRVLVAGGATMFCCSSREEGKKSEARQNSLTPPGSLPAHQSGKPVGVGIVFQPDSTGALHVKSLAAGGPAEKCGLVQVGDVLHEIDGHHVCRKPVAQLAPLILGQEGTVVKLGLQRGSLERLVFVELRRGWSVLPAGAVQQAPPASPSPGAAKWSQAAPQGTRWSNFPGVDPAVPPTA